MTRSVTPPAPPQAAEVREVRFAYARGGRGTPVLDVPVFDVARGECVFVHGPSGSGKTTLLGILAGVLAPSAGSVRVLGAEFSAMSASARDAFRAAHVGYVFQLFNLIPYLSVGENIALPCRLSAARRARLGARSIADAVYDAAARLDIADLLDAAAGALSVGQQQRVAAARALVGAPGLVIADEPTSALDADRRAHFLDLLFESCRDAGAALVFVSHDRALASRFDRAESLSALNRAAATPARDT